MIDSKVLDIYFNASCQIDSATEVAKYNNVFASFKVLT